MALADSRWEGPMVLCRVTPERLNRAQYLADHTSWNADEDWWELIGAGGDLGVPPVAVAVTRKTSGGAAQILQLAADPADPAHVARLVDQLIPVLSRGDARLIVTFLTDPATRAVLLAAGFIAVFDGPAEGSRDGVEALLLPL
jgi:hypothetical protein